MIQDSLRIRLWFSQWSVVSGQLLANSQGRDDRRLVGLAAQALQEFFGCQVLGWVEVVDVVLQLRLQ